jgi:hypothetical protein
MKDPKAEGSFARIVERPPDAEVTWAAERPPPRKPRARGDPTAPADDISLPPPWQRREGPSRAPPPAARASPPGPAPALGAAADRLLVGLGASGAEARLRIGGGPMAGAEIQLRLAGGGIDAIVVARVESSRQTLARAMEEVARRLARKGYTLRFR